MEETVIMQEEAAGFFSNLIAYFDPEIMLYRIISTIIVIVIASVIAKLLSRFFTNLNKRHKASSIYASLMKNTSRVVVWVIAAIVVLQIYGFNLTPVIAGLGVSGVVLGLALQETIQSFFSGLIIAVKRPFEIGDYVTIDDTGGTVKSMDMMGITLTTPDNKLITMSNKNVWGSVIVNTSAMETRRVDMTVSVGYDEDYDEAQRVIMNLLLSYPEVLRDPLPRVEVHTLADSTVDFIARPWVKNSDYWTVYWRFQKDIMPELERHGIDVPYEKLDINITKD